MSNHEPRNFSIVRILYDGSRRWHLTVYGIGRAREALASCRKHLEIDHHRDRNLETVDYALVGGEEE